MLPLPIYVRPCPRDNEVRKPGDGTEPEVQLGRKRTAHGDSESQGRLERNRSASPLPNILSFKKKMPHFNIIDVSIRMVVRDTFR